ncbi:MAG: EamA family transporter [Actinophytocola sp.]|nr:EamA family transporter [Actinophytocola sp.]
MRVESNVILSPKVTGGVLLGVIGVVGFSFSLPATRLAVAGLDPWFVSFGRAVGAGLLAIGYLLLIGAARPSPSQLRRLGAVVLGIVIGFPTFTSLALVTETSAHGAVVIACLPMATAVWAVVRAGERPRAGFWLASSLGMVTVLGFIAATGGLSGGLNNADLFLLAAVVLCGLGYAEGGALSREIGGPQTVCWALVLALPLTVPVTALVAAQTGFSGVSGSAWLGFAYVTTVSMFLGFFAWYAGLARGGVARVGQVQLMQPLLTLGWSVLLLGEHVGPMTLVAAVAVVACVVWTQRARVQAAPSVREEVLVSGRE